MAERLIRTIKNMLYKQFIVQNNQKWYKIQPDIVSQYNAKIHTTIKISSKEATENPERVALINAENCYYNESHLPKKKSKFDPGQRIRIYKFRHTFTKEFVNNWSNEIFRIKKIVTSNPITYQIVDLNGEDILGRFYENEIAASSF